MEVKGSEITQKIRVLITKKLIELGVFVDDELPDYIMVMVANKKSQMNMSDDLQLFLGTHTAHFTDWLNGVLENLPSSVCSDVPAETVPGVDNLEVIKEDEDAFAFKADVTDDFLADELKQQEVQQATLRSGKKEEEMAKAAAKVHGSKRRKTVVDNDDEIEYDPRNPAVGSVASIVRVTRQRWRLPPAVQANKLLLLKAVDEANKSVNKTGSTPYCPTPIHCLSASKRQPLDLVTFVEEPDLRLILKGRVAEGASVVRGAKRKSEDAEQKDESPKFVVTLDGVDPCSFVRSVVARKKGIVMDKDLADEGEESPAKLPERCRYWPACREGDSCSRHHPTLPCRSFPNCRFGDKCFFIHPNCRFDSRCRRNQCPYTHASKRLSAPVVHAAPLPVAWKKPIPCRFLGRCTNPSCPYLHPKPCRFGELCTAADCTFVHPLPSPDRLKWEAPSDSPLQS